MWSTALHKLPYDRSEGYTDEKSDLRGIFYGGGTVFYRDSLLSDLGDKAYAKKCLYGADGHGYGGVYFGTDGASSIQSEAEGRQRGGRDYETWVRAVLCGDSRGQGTGGVRSPDSSLHG